MRQCISLLSTSTTAWVLGLETMELSSLQPDEEPYRVYRLVFPLQELTLMSDTSEISTTTAISSDLTTGDSTSGITSLTTSASSAATAGSRHSHSLSTGAIVGIVIGCCAFFLLIGLVVWIVVRRVRQRPADAGADAGAGVGFEQPVNEVWGPAELLGVGVYGKQPLVSGDDMNMVRGPAELGAVPIRSVAELPVNIRPVAELPVTIRPTAELPV